MFRPTTTQSSLFDPINIFPGILPSDDWSFIYRDKIYPLIDEKKFKPLYSESGGAPNKSVKLQVSILIFMGIEKINWRDAEFLYPRRIDWLNATYTPFGEAKIDHTTLFKFYQRLENNETAYELFKELTTQFIIECGVSVAKQRVDSFFMHGWLETLSRYGLLKETNRVFLQNLRKHKPGLYEEIKSELSRDYLEKDFDLTEKDKEKANKKISEMAKDMYDLKNAFENHKQVKNYESFQTLLTVFEQQCAVRAKNNSQKEKAEGKDIKDKDCDVEIEIRERPEGEKIISTPHNTDAEYTRKRKQKVTGHKAFVTETCDEDNDVQFITDANLENARHSDANEIIEIEDRLEKNKFKPKKLEGDAGFVNGKTILESEKRGIDLAGPSSGRSQSLEGFAKEDRPLDIADFEVKIDGESGELTVISCPSGHLPTAQKRSEKTGKVIVHFDRDVCEQCSKEERCPVKKGVRVASLTVSEEQYAGAQRHHQYMEDEDYRKECAIRAGAESLVNEVANGHGARKSRHRSQERSKLQLIFASIACNVKRFIRYEMERCAQNQSKMQEVRG